VFASLGVLIGASYAIRTAARLFTGPMRPEMQNVRDLHSHELIAAGTLAVGIMALGLVPGPIVELMNASVNELSMIFSHKNF
jgi:NADH-quinone oxidoreductase subunit M